MNTLERLQELAKAATPGPWVVGGSYTVRTMRSSLDWIARMRDRHHSHADSEDAANAKLIVTLHNALPDLLAVVEAAKELAEVARLRGDDELPHPANDTKLWTARMQTAWDEVHAALAKLTEAAHD